MDGLHCGVQILQWTLGAGTWRIQQNDQKSMCWNQFPHFLRFPSQIPRTWFSAFSDWRLNLRGWGTSVRSTPRKSKRRSIRRPWMSPSFGAQDHLKIMAIVGNQRIQAPNPPSETTKPLNNWWKQLLCAVSCCRWNTTKHHGWNWNHQYCRGTVL